MRPSVYLFLSMVIAIAACKSRKTKNTVTTAPSKDTVVNTGGVVEAAPVEKQPVKISVSRPADTIKTVAVATSITWLDFESGYRQAVAEKKVLLVDAYTDWCYWCKVMDRETFTDTGVVSILNKYFVMTKLNPEKDKTFVFGDKTMNNVELYKWLGHGKMFGFPTIYFWLFPGSTEERYSLAGFTEPAEFKQILRKILNKRWVDGY